MKTGDKVRVVRVPQGYRHSHEDRELRIGDELIVADMFNSETLFYREFNGVLRALDTCFVATEAAPPGRCTCETRDLFWGGCKCGWIERERQGEVASKHELKWAAWWHIAETSPLYLPQEAITELFGPTRGLYYFVSYDYTIVTGSALTDEIIETQLPKTVIHGYKIVMQIHNPIDWYLTNVVLRVHPAKTELMYMGGPL